MPLLEVRNLRVEFPVRFGTLSALRDVSFSLDAGRALGIVGESGAGKSLVAFSLLNLLAPPGRVVGGEVIFEGRDLLKLPPEELRKIRGGRMAMIFQDPMTTLNPVLTVGEQLAECLLAHQNVSAREARRAAEERLREVAIPDPAARMDSYPHELSGGMRQRVVIAAALMTAPALIVADEPTTALDVTIQAEIMALLARLRRTRNMALILISHDLALVSQAADEALVMYAGKAAERAPAAELIARPLHPYTRGLLGALPDNADANGRFRQIPGAMPPLSAVPTGCAFHPRCPRAQALCRENDPPIRGAGNGREVACHFPLDSDSGKIAPCESSLSTQTPAPE